jgi:hypothetical protein
MKMAIAALACSIGLVASGPILASEVEGYVDTVMVGSDGLIRFTMKNYVVYNYSMPSCTQGLGVGWQFAIHPSETTKQALRDIVLSSADGKTKLRVSGSNTCAYSNWPLTYVQGVGAITSTSAP